MINAIEYGLQRVQREVSEVIINMAFGLSQWEYTNNRFSIDAMVRREVLEKQVLVDCNIVGGTTCTIPLNQCSWANLSEGVRIEIPMQLTQGRHISAVHSIEVVNRLNEPYAVSPGQPGSTGTSEVFLVGPNIIFTPLNIYNTNSHLRCVIENAENLSNFNQKALMVFGDLCVLAAKGTIYTRLAINNTITANTGGMIDGRLRGIIDEYADSWEIYNEMMRIKWKKISMINDTNFHQRLIKMGISK